MKKKIMRLNIIYLIQNKDSKKANASMYVIYSHYY